MISMHFRMNQWAMYGCESEMRKTRDKPYIPFAFLPFGIFLSVEQVRSTM